MATVAAGPHLTPAQYLELERKADSKHEYREGRMIAMAGASEAHNLIAGSIYAELRVRFRDRPCRVYSSDLRVAVSPDGLYTYPDVSALCAQPRFLDGRRDTLLNPMVIVEVLSPSTEADDRGWKFAEYRRMESLQEYVLVAQDRISVERFSRQGEMWVLTVWDRLEDALRLDSVGCEIPLRDIYAQVELAGREPPAGG